MLKLLYNRIKNKLLVIKKKKKKFLLFVVICRKLEFDSIIKNLNILIETIK